MWVAFEHGAEIVHVLANRNGDRYSRRGKKRGGKRIKGFVLNECIWLHLLARSAW